MGREQGQENVGGEGGETDGTRGDWEVFVKEQINTDQLAMMGFFVSNSSVTAFQQLTQSLINNQ